MTHVLFFCSSKIRSFCGLHAKTWYFSPREHGRQNGVKRGSDVVLFVPSVGCFPVTDEVGLCLTRVKIYRDCTGRLVSSFTRYVSLLDLSNLILVASIASACDETSKTRSYRRAVYRF